MEQRPAPVEKADCTLIGVAEGHVPAGGAPATQPQASEGRRRTSRSRPH